ncbi:MAG: alpha/beta fold hydrolase [Saprospiraceae bacterium]|nr:alpha/beta fold hydrolase [Saprospiraceae bacterium]
MEPYWLDQKTYPFTAHYMEINGYKLHYIDEGQGEIILFVHGTPSWSFDYRECIKAMSKTHRCIAVDHIGFGLSDKPDIYDYSTINHSKTLEHFILDKGLKDFTLVVHDFGGPIGLNFAIKYPDMVKRLVILNSWLWSSKDDPEFIKLSSILKSPLLPFLYRYLNFSARYILPKSFGDHKLSKHLLRQYTMPFGDRTQRNGPLAFARSLLDDQDWFESLWNAKTVLEVKPTLFIWGMKDPVIKLHILEKFVSGFPLAKVLRLESSGHFPQEEQPEEVIKAINSFLKAN